MLHTAVELFFSWEVIWTGWMWRAFTLLQLHSDSLPVSAPRTLARQPFLPLCPSKPQSLRRCAQERKKWRRQQVPAVLVIPSPGSDSRSITLCIVVLINSASVPRGLQHHSGKKLKQSVFCGRLFVEQSWLIGINYVKLPHWNLWKMWQEVKDGCFVFALCWTRRHNRLHSKKGNDFKIFFSLVYTVLTRGWIVFNLAR